MLKLLRLGIVGIAIGLGVAACGGGSSSYVAKVGSQPITEKQVDAVMRYDRSQYPRLQLRFPPPGSPEYVLLRQQAIDFLVEQSRAHQADAKLGVPPQDRVVSDAAFRKVTAKVHVSEAQVEEYFRRHRTKSQLDLGTAQEIRQQLLEKRRATIMHGFAAAVRRDYPVTYGPGYAPVSEIALARRIWVIHPSHKPCDLKPGMYQYPTAVEHGCAQPDGPVVISGEPPCAIVDPPHSNGGFSSAEEDDGFAEYAADNGGTCTSDPRGGYVEVSAPPKPVVVSYLRRSGTATFKDPQAGFTLRYPRRLRVQHVEYGDLATVEGVEVANYPIERSGSYPQLPARAVELTFTQPGGGRIGRPSASATSFPIKLSAAFLTAGTHTRYVTADGMTFSLTLRTGSSPTRRDLAAVRAIAASIRFPPLRIGHLLPNHLYVLGRASSYPVGSVTEVAANSKLEFGRFDLEHTADGFWMITWPDDLLHGYKACGPHYDAKLRVFRCPGGAVWNLKGQVVTNPDPKRYQDDPLARTPVTVADGLVLVEPPPPPPR